MNLLLTSESEVGAELAGGERLLWSGQPRQGVVFRGSDVFMIPFSLMWGGFAIFWEAGVIMSGAPLFFTVWGVPFVLVGLYMIFGRFFVDARRRGRTFYGVTDKRVIIVSGALSRKVKSMNLRTLSDLLLSERGDGSGTITFGARHPMDWWLGGTTWPGMPEMSPAFELIADARGVYEVIRDAQAKA